MAIPTREDLKVGLIELLKGRASIRPKDAYDYLADRFALTKEDLAKRRGKASHFQNEVRWAKEELKNEGMIAPPQIGGRGKWSLRSPNTESVGRLASGQRRATRQSHKPRIQRRRRHAAVKPSKRPAKDGLAEAVRELFLTENEIKTCLDLLRLKKNLVLAGPPGVGKTYVASTLAWLLVGSRDDQRVERVQFHQSYSYEDFVQGIRPTKSGFETRDGPFLQFCRTAHQDFKRPYVLVIDEINRGNLSRIFGELMLLLEGDKRSDRWGVRLTYAEPNSDRFWVPPNLYIIGTMNTADRSLAMVDYALRRRFAFFDVKPAFETPKFKEYLISKGVETALLERILRGISALNDDIRSDKRSLGEGYLIGHSYFCAAQDETCDEQWYERIIQYEVRPLLQEYWFDARERVNQHVDRLLKTIG